MAPDGKKELLERLAATIHPASKHDRGWKPLLQAGAPVTRRKTQPYDTIII